MKTSIVTGGAGCIGSNLCQELLQEGNKVIAIDNLITSTGENITPLLKNPNFRFIKHDITKPLPKIFNSQFSTLNSIYHLACPTGVPNMEKLAYEMLLTCSAGTFNVLELARRTKAKFLFASSSEVYGNPKVFPQKETYTGNVDPIGSRSPYEEGKRFSESLVKAYVNKYNLNAKIVRVFNTYGPGMSIKDERVIPHFLYAIKNRKPLPIQEDGLQSRTFCYVDDLVNGLLLIMEKGNKGEVYNIGSDQEITIMTLAKNILEISDAKRTFKFVKRPIHDPKRRCPDITKIKKLGWEPKTRLAVGLKKTLLWYGL